MAELPTTPESLHPVTGSNKRLSVERIYQRKTQLEHILLRPDTYVGSVEEATDNLYVFDSEQNAIVKKQIAFVPGLYKIFDEILVNAADNKQRDKNMNTIKITIDSENNTISVWNNGCGIPVEMHSTENKYVPELIFGTLLTSSNYDDGQKKVTGGRNGYGAKLCNIFSTEFTVETSYSRSKKLFKMTWKDNMGKAGKTILKESKSDYTRISFKPDLAKFGMTHLTSDMVALMTRRAYDLAGCIRGVSVYFNGEKIPVKSFRDYIELYLRGIPPSPEDEEMPRKIVHEVINNRWEIAVTASHNGFQQASFVNSIATTKGGTHVAYVTDQVVSKLLENAKRKNKGGIDLKPLHIKGHLWIFINCLIENPAFDSQTKENLTLKSKNFGSTCPLSEKFIKSALSCGVIERVLNWARAKSQSVIAKKQSGSKHTKLRGIPKLDDANDAGSKNSLDCTLIVTEGDSAKTLAVSGLGVVGRDHYGVFPLRGKLLNVRDATHNQLMGNEEITNLVKIMGLNYSKSYSEPSDLRSLRYGRLMIMADQDQDGSHIKGLVINFIHNKWPKLLTHNFVEEFITPIVKVTRGSQSRSFYSLPEFEQWSAQTENQHLWKVKYYKGLGTSTSKEAKEYFSDMDRHRVPFKYAGQEDDEAITLAFSKKKVEQRKEWLTSWLENRRQRRAQGLNESLLYECQTDHISYSDFVNKELILFSNMDNERSIPCVVDGLKPGQRKVLYTCFKRNDKREIKVAQLAGSVAEHSAYHHGEASLMSTIINLCQNFVGSNNINILQPLGQFGTRLHGGKDAASPRYIFTMLSPLTRLLFPSNDDTQLNNLFEDNLKIEPEWYCPIIPLILTNGGEGIGTGYSTNIPNFNPREIVENIRRMIRGEDPVPMHPWYKNFTGSISHVEPLRYMTYGKVAILSQTSIEITELPVRTWTQHYKESVLEALLHGNEKIQPFISDYKEYHTDMTVRFVVTMTPEKFAEAQKVGFYKKFKLESSLSINNLVAFDHHGCLKRYSGPIEILEEFFEVRLDMYLRRKEYMEGMLNAEAARLTNQARFILEKIDGLVVVENKKKARMIEDLREAGYRSDPIKAWKKSLKGNDEEVGSDEEAGEDSGLDFNYLLSMSMWSLTMEKKEELLKQRDNKVEELRILRDKTHRDLWKEDLEAFLVELDRVEAVEREELESGSAIVVKRSKKGKSKARQTTLAGASKNNVAITKPSSFGEYIAPTVPVYNDKPKGLKRPKKEVKEVAKPVATASKDKVADTVANSDEDFNNIESISLAQRMARKANAEKKQSKLSFSAGTKDTSEPAKEDLGEAMEMDEPSTPELEHASPVRPKRVTKKKVALNLDVSTDDVQEFDDSEDDFVVPKKRAISKSKSSSSVSSIATAQSSSTESGKGKSRKAASKKAAPKLVMPEISGEDDSFIGHKSSGKSAPKVLESSDDEDLNPSKKALPSKKATAPKKVPSKSVINLEGSDDDDTHKLEPVSKKRLLKKPPAKKVPTKRKQPVVDLGDSDDGDTEQPLKTSIAPKKVPAKTKESVIDLRDSDDAEAFEPPPKKRATTSKQSVFDCDSDDDFAPTKKKAVSKVEKPKATRGRPAKKATEKAAPKRKAKSSQKTLLDLGRATKKGTPDLDDLLTLHEEDGGEKVVPLTKKSAPAKKAAPKQKTGAKRSRAVVSDESSAGEDSPSHSPPNAKRPTRGKKVTYTLEDSEESDFEFSAYDVSDGDSD